jgi:hypothetical protein
MLLFAVCWISISTTFGLSYEDRVADFENMLGECLSIIDDVGNYVDDVLSLGNVRRRLEEEENSSHSVQEILGACVSMQKAVDNYRVDHSRLLMFQKSFHWQGQDKVYLNELLLPLSKEIGMPIYVASIDGDRAADFHDKCDGKGPTVVIVETTDGHIFGGYTDISWDDERGTITSSTSFLFQLRPNFSQHGIKEGQEGNAVVHNSNLGPTFGLYDLVIKDQALSARDSYLKETSYDNIYESEIKFQVRDYVVLKATAL